MTTDVIGDGTTEMKREEKLAVAKARATIIQGLGEKPLRLCMGEKGNHFKMWQRISERYAVANIVTKVKLQTKLARTNYTGQRMAEFVDSFEKKILLLAAINSPIAEDLQVAMLLASFADKKTSPFGHATVALLSFDKEFSWENASPTLLQEYDEKVWLASQPKQMKKKSPTSALFANNQRQKGKGWKRLERRRCFGCGKKGHLVKCCTDARGQENSNNSENTTTFANHATLLMARKRSCDDRALIVDSGASEHMIMHLEWLSNVQPTEPRTIVLGNGNTVTATCKGDMNIIAKLIGSADTTKVTLRDV